MEFPIKKVDDWCPKAPRLGPSKPPVQEIEPLCLPEPDYINYQHEMGNDTFTIKFNTIQQEKTQEQSKNHINFFTLCRNYYYKKLIQHQKKANLSRKYQNYQIKQITI